MSHYIQISSKLLQSRHPHPDLHFFGGIPLMVVMYFVAGTSLGLLLARFDDRPLFRSFLMGAGHIPFVMGDALFDLRVNDPGLCRLGIMLEALANNSLIM